MVRWFRLIYIVRSSVWSGGGSVSRKHGEDGLARLAFYTLAWCLFVPLFLFRNRGLKKPMRPKMPRRVATLIKRRRPLLAWEMLWSECHPLLTEETIKPVYR